jgi:hypothetical protein
MKRALIWFGPLVLCLVVLSGIAAIYYQSGKVIPDELAALIDSADEVRVYGSGLGDDYEADPLYTSRDRADLDALKVALAVEIPSEYHHCLCSGAPAVCLYRNGAKIGQITNHHEKRLRCDLWWSDAPIADVHAFLSWFDARGMPWLREGFERNAQEDRAEQLRKQKWLAAAPAGFFEFNTRTVDACVAAMRKHCRDDEELILRLFGWYGVEGELGEDVSLGYGAREVLERFSTDALLGAVEGKELSTEQTGGVAQLFIDWDFGGDRPHDYRRLSPDLRRRLLQHGAASANEEFRRRARITFGEEPED